MRRKFFSLIFFSVMTKRSAQPKSPKIYNGYFTACLHTHRNYITMKSKQANLVNSYVRKDDDDG